MEAARRLDEWKVLARKIPGVDHVPGAQAPRHRRARDALSARVEPRHPHRRAKDASKSSRARRARTPSTRPRSSTGWSRRTSSTCARATRTRGGPRPRRHGLRAGTGALAAVRTRRPRPRRLAGQSGRLAARRVLGDEKKILMILCTRVKQEAEGAIGEANLPGIDRPYKQALAEIDRGPRRRGRAGPDPRRPRRRSPRSGAPP